MARGLIMGTTDFSNQSIQEIKKELNNWIRMAEETLRIIQEIQNELNEEYENYYERIAPYDFRQNVWESMNLYENVIETSKEIISGLENEFLNHHVKRARSIGDQSYKLYRNYKKSWKEDGAIYSHYEDPAFFKLEQIYIEGSNSLLDLVDFDNLSYRLEDFVGRGKELKNNNKSVNAKVYNNYNMQNNSNINIDNKVANSGGKIEEPKKTIFSELFRHIKNIFQKIKNS